MAAKQRGLGRGLGALIQDASGASAPAESGRGGTAAEPTVRARVAEIRKSPWQPRHRFEEEALSELIESVRERGVLQPLLVRKLEDGFELIAGERRLRAAQEANLKDVPVVIMEVSDQEALEIALVENLQRSDLNLMEEAEGYRMLGETFRMTQEQIAQKVGKARPTIANALRLLDLPDGVKQLVAERRLTPGHAKALLGLEIPQEQELLARRVVNEDISVRSLERIVAQAKKAPRKQRAAKDDVPLRHLHDLAEQMQGLFGTSVRITPSRTLANGKKAKGVVEIDFYSADELDRLISVLGLQEEL